MLSVVACSVLAISAYAQVPAGVEHYIEEKIKNEEVREYVMNHTRMAYEAREAGQTYIPQGPTPAEFMTEIGYETSPKGINHAFSATGGAEPFIAVNPSNANHIAVSYMSRADADYPVFITFDGGSTWQQSAFSSLAQLDVVNPGAFVLGGGDPVLAFDDAGNLHMTYIYAHGAGFPVLGSMYYVNSTDGGLTFDIPAGGAHVIYEGDIFAGDLLDRQWMHCDVTGGTNDGNLYMSAVYFGGGFGTAGELVLKKTPADDGFSSSVVGVAHSGGMSTQFGNLKVDNAGNVHMACMLFDGASGAGTIEYVKSTDGAATFPTGSTIGTATTGLPNDAATHVVHNRDNAATSLAVDGDNVYVAWCDFASGGIEGFFSYSNDGGVTFSAPTEFGETIFGAGYHHVMPVVAADSGRVSIAWYKVDTTTFDTQYILAESDDAGASFSTHMTISQGNTDFANESDQDFYGDYNCMEKKGCRTFAIFSDGNTGAPVVYFVNQDACNLVGVEEITPVNVDFEIGSVYPNPTTDHVTVQMNSENPMDGKIQIIDQAGRIVLEQNETIVEGVNSINLNLSSVPRGVYRLKLSTPSGFAVRALVKK